MTVIQNACGPAHLVDGLLSGVWSSRLRKPRGYTMKTLELKNLERSERQRATEGMTLVGIKAAGRPTRPDQSYDSISPVSLRRVISSQVRRLVPIIRLIGLTLRGQASG